MLPVILSTLIGGGLGAALGYFGQCSSGTCPLTSTWWRGALYGGVMGLMLGWTSLRSHSGAADPSTPNVQRIGEAEFEAEVARAAGPVLVDFYAPWCGPCKALAPRLEALAGEFTNRIRFVKVNVDEAPGLAQRWEIGSVPTLLLFKEGRVVDRVAGLASAAALRQRLEPLAGGGRSAVAQTAPQN